LSREVKEMSATYKIRRLAKKLFSPVSIMMVPHDSKKSINIKVPSIGIFISVFLWLAGSFYLGSLAIDAFEYQRMKLMVDQYNSQFTELKPTILMLKKAETEFKSLLSRGGKKEILENVSDNKESEDSGSVDMDSLKEEIKKSAESIASVREFFREQRDIYLSTPTGWPVSGRITSPFGNRQSPRGGGAQFHTGMDISIPSGTPVKATADGVVSFSGWLAGNGNLVVLEHGFGYSTCFAHNKSTVVKVGQKVKRGEVIAYSGSTGNSTGPHVHYEVWKNGKAVNPRTFLEASNHGDIQ
jgi:murein DD-endopeptidase MepM/ murein hydrolase activator NlpD